MKRGFFCLAAVVFFVTGCAPTEYDINIEFGDGGVAIIEDGGVPAVFTEDGGLPADGGMTQDGGVPSDGGLPSDGGIPAADGGLPSDGGVPTADGGLPADGGPSPDGGPIADGGVAMDGGLPADGGVTSDGGIDGGTDGGVPDGGVVPDFCSETNLISNGGFENSFVGWDYERLPGHENSNFEHDCSRVYEGVCSARVANNRVGSYFNVQLKQPSVPITAFQKYRLNFCVRADAPRIFRAQVMEENPPWANGGFYETLTLDEGNRWGCYQYYFTVAPVVSTYRLTFHFGDSTVPMNVDAVMVKRCPNP